MNWLINMKLKTKTEKENYLKLIRKLWKSKRRVWRRVVELLNTPRSRHVAINLGKINRNTKDGDIIIVPGKILGCGDLNHNVSSIAAISFSESARKKMMDKKIPFESIETLYERNPEGKNIKIIT